MSESTILILAGWVMGFVTGVLVAIWAMQTLLNRQNRTSDDR